MKELSPNELSILLLSAMTRVIGNVGGGEKWDSMDAVSRQPFLTEMMEEIAQTLGTEVLNSLPPEEKRSVELFFWAGCSMHKELNSVKGGNTAMMNWWAKNSITPPVLLANKDNDATIQLTEIVNASAVAVQRALETSTRGGVKAANLAGAIFNHKDDKKGQQDIHRLFFMQFKGGVMRKFPDTSNTRYHSHCDAATELLKFLEFYIEFLEFIRLNKTNSKLNHMEENLLKALCDTATLTELAVLTLYSQAVTKPYMRKIRAPGCEELNILDMGPLHEKLKVHITILIANPELLLNNLSDSYLHGAFDGKPWDDFAAVQTVIAMYNAGKLLHLKDVLVAFLQGAHSTWMRFTEEFAIGGLIATSTAEERDLAAMPTTNDINEGMLGSWRKHAREKPSTTVGHFSDQAAFSRNDTQEFMNAMFTDEDHAHLRHQARRIDKSGVERQQREALIQHKLDSAAAAKKKATERQACNSAKEAYFSGVALVLDKNQLTHLLDPALKDQIEVYRRLGVEKHIPLKSQLKSKSQRLELLRKLSARHSARLRGELVTHDNDLDDTDDDS
jgi:hypothetical protein